MLDAADWFAQLAEGDDVYLSSAPDARPSRVIRIDRSTGGVLVAPLSSDGRPGALGMPMFFVGRELDDIAAADQAQWAAR